MDERDIELIKIHTIDREWNPDDLADWRETVDKFTYRDKIDKLHAKNFGAREFALDVLIELNFFEKKLNPKHIRQVKEAISLSAKEDEEFYLRYGIDRQKEEHEEWLRKERMLHEKEIENGNFPRKEEAENNDNE